MTYSAVATGIAAANAALDAGLAKALEGTGEGPYYRVVDDEDNILIEEELNVTTPVNAASNRVATLNDIRGGTTWAAHESTALLSGTIAKGVITNKDGDPVYDLPTSSLNIVSLVLTAGQIVRYTAAPTITEPAPA
jgi:hypothetical protein